LASLTIESSEKLLTTVTEISDEEILDLLQVKQQSERGFRLLMDKYQERLYWHIRRMVVSHEDANDVLQNTLIKAYRGIVNFQGNSKLFTWLYRIGTNESITFLNNKKRKATETMDADNGIASQLVADSFFDGNEAQVLLQRALEQLPAKQKAVFSMRYYDELSYQTISDIVGTSVGGLKASYHHAVKKIEAFIKNN